jgi:CRP-like cAMP-binding protein
MASRPRSKSASKSAKSSSSPVTTAPAGAGGLVDSGDRTAAAVWAAAESDFGRGRWRQALSGYAAVVQSCPHGLRSRLRVADALLNLGMQREALAVYRAVAFLAAATGRPLLALVALKIAALVDPTTDASGFFGDYARGAERLDAFLSVAPPPVPGAEPTAPLVDDGALVAQAVAVASALPPLPPPGPVPPIPLLSHLEEDELVAAIGCLRLRRFSDGDLIICQGERNESVFLVADGEVAIRREDDDGDAGVTLALLRGGAVFGELALISDEPRQASAVALGDVDILEMRRSDLIVAAARLPGLSDALRLFTRERFLRNLTATHPFFAPLSRDDRHRVMELTHVLTFQAGDVLIEEGQRGPGLFVLLGGAASVKKAAATGRAGETGAIHLATLRGGDLCGEMSLLTDEPTTATVTCSADLEALFLSRDAFASVTSKHPELLRYLAGLTDERLRRTRALLHGPARLEDDEQVMI